MGNQSKIGRIFFGISIAVLGFLTVYYHDYPYMLIPPHHSSMPGFLLLAYIFGVMLILAGLCIVLVMKITSAALMLGSILLLIFCFYFIPYEFIVSPNYMHLADWENAEKEVALVGGAFVIAGCFSNKNENHPNRYLGKLVPLGRILFSIPIISFGILHFLYAKDVAEYVPSWVPYRLFWAYLAGAGLLCSGIAIILKIKTGLAATLLGTMIFIWFIILHMPRMIGSSTADMGSEVTSAFIALAYSGIAFVIGAARKQKANQMYG